MSWKAVRGHDRLVAAFQEVIRRGRLAHAYLFVGPAGVGKQRFAVELAKALLCEAPGAQRKLDACDTCPACVQVTTGTHPDFRASDAERNHQYISTLAHVESQRAGSDTEVTLYRFRQPLHEKYSNRI